MTITRLLRRPRVLIVGCGDVGLRAARMLLARAAPPRVIALTSRPEGKAELRAAGASPILGNLDAARSLRRLTGLAPTVLHLAPPPQQGEDDPRTRALIAALTAPYRASAASRPHSRARSYLRGSRFARRWGGAPQTAIVTEAARATWGRRPPRIVYASTTGVYGDCGGALVDETRPVRPLNARAKRRVAAERQLRRATARGALSACIVRIPGIYAAERLPLARIEQRMPALVEDDDVYTNHIHADDLAAILLRALARAGTSRVVHASDDTVLKMGEYFDRIADAFGLARVPRITREQAQDELSPLTLSFMSESRRLANRRLIRELRVRLRFPTVDDFLATVRRN
ncbi:nucleoside-diphosphate-sugar epimerase [Trinickia symbiotica]|uniref:NAD(P)-dependent oxidoreductase n=1 Tax=Trinickia symbiotica TaxID=863227 RepID=A0A2N7X341_9BURK|nr:NAD-dependent epimerase/dehydratase family protein [Trinickia symbiotica]PMS36178.1 NAD(P)-dependent oxidoreductase [Trinickia symbiotica]PPK45877.1 nucleoside-diphosphate-sugar epimerase [Trinickia symbiotica]